MYRCIHVVMDLVYLCIMCVCVSLCIIHRQMLNILAVGCRDSFLQLLHTCIHNYGSESFPSHPDVRTAWTVDRNTLGPACRDPCLAQVTLVLAHRWSRSLRTWRTQWKVHTLQVLCQVAFSGSRFQGLV